MYKNRKETTYLFTFCYNFIKIEHLFITFRHFNMLLIINKGNDIRVAPNCLLDASPEGAK